MRESRSLAGQFDPRRNSLNALRLLFALMVVLWHSEAIGFVGRAHGEVGSMWGDELAVDGFFIISGFLITRSRVSSTNGWRFLQRRFLRIYPGYWAALVIGAVVVAPMLYLHEHHHLSGYLRGGGGPIEYVGSNLTLFVHQYGISGVVANAPARGSINGSLWTLMYEFACYLVIGALVSAGLVRRQSLVVPALGAVCLALVAWHTYDAAGMLQVLPSPVLIPISARFGMMFSIGASFYLWAARIRLNDGLAAVAAVLLVSSWALPDWRLAGAIPFAYLIMWAAIRLPAYRVGSRVDLSYGVYLYAWPIQVLLYAWGASQLTLAAFTAFSVLLALAAAYLSWTLVERPAQRLGARRRPAVVAP